jgi:hypothetical protein
LFAQTRVAFRQDRVFDRAFNLAKGFVLNFGRHTITGLLTATGRQFQDWSADYRIFEEERFAGKKLFEPAIDRVLADTNAETPLYTMMDDTLIRKRGRRVAGAAWKRDPLGPAFHTNFVWGQRYLQLSAALPDFQSDGRARGIPIDFIHAPSAIKPRKNSPGEAWDEYRKQQKQCKITAVGASRLAELREQVPDRKIVCAVDGGYTNRELFGNIPENTVLIGRIRKDASLFGVPEKPAGMSRGRKKYYGDKLQTPEEIRKDDSVPWQPVQAFAAGKTHIFDVKVVSSVRWKPSKDRDMSLIVIRPLGYRPRKGAKMLYRDPAYLICSDVSMSPEELLQAYLWRWEIEVNFKEEKTVLGVGEAQVRKEESVRSAPAFGVACYAFLLLSAHAMKAKSTDIPTPLWYPQTPSRRCSLQNMISLFRARSWNIHLEHKKSGFESPSCPTRSHFFSLHAGDSAVCYASK